MIYPIVFRRLQSNVGFDWVVRVIAFIAVATLLVSLSVMKTRLKHEKTRAFLEPAAFKGVPVILFIAGLFLAFVGIYVPFFNLAYGERVIGTSIYSFRGTSGFHTRKNFYSDGVCHDSNERDFLFFFILAYGRAVGPVILALLIQWSGFFTLCGLTLCGLTPHDLTPHGFTPRVFTLCALCVLCTLITAILGFEWNQIKFAGFFVFFFLYQTLCALIIAILIFA